ncbi:MAG: hypothetical protein M3400_16940 [Actinomycetota bacterium]|nr:hypothetical protein [Actinomycetota bacterium]
MADFRRMGAFLPLFLQSSTAHACVMFFIHCPTTDRDELIADRRVVRVVNRPTDIAVVLACHCGKNHVIRTGRKVLEGAAA